MSPTEEKVKQLASQLAILILCVSYGTYAIGFILQQLVDDFQDVSSSNKNKHTFYHFMHGKVDKSCPFIDQSEKVYTSYVFIRQQCNYNFCAQNCDSDYQPEFARGLKVLLEGHENEPPVEDYSYYIHDHLKYHCNSSPCCSKLWYVKHVQLVATYMVIFLLGAQLQQQ